MKIGKWRLLSEKTCFKNPWWSVDERQYATPNGKKIKWFVVKKPDAVCVFCLTKQKKIVCVRHYRPGVGKIVLDLPTGYIDKGETPLEAAKRELKEETGYGAKKFVSLGAYAGNAASDNIMLHAFIALGGELAGKQDLDESEEIEVRLLSQQELLRKIESTEFLDATRVGVVYRALQKLGKLGKLRT